MSELSSGRAKANQIHPCSLRHSSFQPKPLAQDKGLGRGADAHRQLPLPVATRRLRKATRSHRSTMQFASPFDSCNNKRKRCSIDPCPNPTGKSPRVSNFYRACARFWRGPRSACHAKKTTKKITKNIRIRKTLMMRAPGQNTIEQPA